VHEPYEGNPVAAARPLRPGQLGLVMAPPGLGKTTFLVHAALSRLLVGESVLHLALDQSVAHAIGHYDALLALVDERLQIEGAAAVVERNRRVLAPGSDVDWDRLATVWEAWADWTDFEPRLAVLDGWSASRGSLVDSLAAAKRHLSARGVSAWISLRAEPESEAGAEVLGLADQIVRLVTLGGAIGLQVSVPLRDGDEPDTLAEPHMLDATSLLLQPAKGRAPSSEMGLDPRQCMLYSGGAPGAESAFGEIAERYGLREVAFTFEGHRQTRTQGQRVLSPAELAMGDVSLTYVSKRLHRNYHDRESLIRGVLQTIWHMVSRSQQVFVVGAIQEDGTVRGGTGWAVELAAMWSRELWVFDLPSSRWHRWSGCAFGPGQPRITTREFCGTGTRTLPEAGRQAIERLFAHSFDRGA